jgi:putative peptide zinc metalloprotease protein
MSSSSGSGTASGRMVCPDPGKLVLDGNETAQGADHPNESLRQGAWLDLAAGRAVATARPAASASSRDRVSNAEIGSAVPYLVPEIQRLIRRARRGPAAGAYVPQLAPGVEQLGEYQGSGLTNATYLVRNPGGKVVQVSRLLHLVLSGIDGSRTISEIAVRVTGDFGRTVSVGNVEYLLANKLAPLGLLAVGDGAHQGAAAAGQDQALLALKLHRTLVPAAGVQHIANLFRPLFNPFVVAAVLTGLIASDAWLIRGRRIESALLYMLLNPMVILLVLGLAVLSMLFHECGHAAACRYGGARPGIIGVGFFVIWPAFFTNVTDTYRLGRAGRIRTDLGGVYFNAVFALGLVEAYLATGYAPLVAALFLVHMEIIQQLMPSLRLDGYFILTDLIGVPDLFKRIVPTLRSMIPGRPADPRVGGLKRRARVALTAWVLLVIPLLGGQLTLIILNGPALVRTFVRSVDAQAHDVAAAFGRIDIAYGVVSAVSLVLLVLPMAGLGYILLSTGRRAGRAVIAVNRRHPVLRVPSVAVVLLIAAALGAHWGLLPIGRGAVSPQPGEAAAGGWHPPMALRSGPDRPARPAGPAAAVLRPVSAHGFDALTGPGSDPGDENDDLARYAIDGNPSSAWQTQHYFGNPVFAGLKTGTGLILDMGRPIRLRSVTVTFGPAPSADVSIKVGNHNTRAASTLSRFTTVARAQDIGGTYTFTCTGPARGRYVLIWFTKLPPAGSGGFQARIFNILVRGWG